MAAATTAPTTSNERAGNGRQRCPRRPPQRGSRRHTRTGRGQSSVPRGSSRYVLRGCRIWRSAKGKESVRPKSHPSSVELVRAGSASRRRHTWRKVDVVARAEVVLTVANDRRLSVFRCPRCRRKVRVIATFPFMWSYKTCAGCRTVWNLVGPEDWRMIGELPSGYAQTITVVAYDGTDADAGLLDSRSRH